MWNKFHAAPMPPALIRKRERGTMHREDRWRENGRWVRSVRVSRRKTKLIDIIRFLTGEDMKIKLKKRVRLRFFRCCCRLCCSVTLSRCSSRCFRSPPRCRSHSCRFTVARGWGSMYVIRLHLANEISRSFVVATNFNAFALDGVKYGRTFA